ncbi:hypothetical protein [Thalassobacillus hwangdonensis]|uniref:DUF2178 domain-containing protein n=1 Tax=Thalassobacillus hwangdonensis TaxID=546108 RepID=A0ABW3L6E9_9BACI
MIFAGIILMPVFLVSLYIIFKVSWGEEGKDERGQAILNKSYMFSAPILPIGWLLLETAHSFSEVSYDFYRDTMWVLILLTFIVQGATLYTIRKRA